MKDLSSKQTDWLYQNIKTEMVIERGDNVSLKILNHSMGFFRVEEKIIISANEENYNFGLITKEQLLSRTDKITNRLRKISNSSREWLDYFPQLKNIS